MRTTSLLLPLAAAGMVVASPVEERAAAACKAPKIASALHAKASVAVPYCQSILHKPTHTVIKTAAKVSTTTVHKIASETKTVTNLKVVTSTVNVTAKPTTKAVSTTKSSTSSAKSSSSSAAQSSSSASSIQSSSSSSSSPSSSSSASLSSHSSSASGSSSSSGISSSSAVSHSSSSSSATAAPFQTSASSNSSSIISSSATSAGSSSSATGSSTTTFLTSSTLATVNGTSSTGTSTSSSIIASVTGYGNSTTISATGTGSYSTGGSASPTGNSKRAMFEPHHFKRAGVAEPKLFNTLKLPQISTACSCLNVPNPTVTHTKTNVHTKIKIDRTTTYTHTVSATKKATATHTTKPFILQVGSTGTVRDGYYIVPYSDVTNHPGQAVAFGTDINAAQEFVITPQGYLAFYGTSNVMNLQSGLHYGSALFETLGYDDQGKPVAGVPFTCSISTAKVLSCGEGGVNHFEVYNSFSVGLTIADPSYVSSNSFFQPATLKVTYV